MIKRFSIQSAPTLSRHSGESRSPVLFLASLDSRLRGNDEMRVLNDDFNVISVVN